MGISGEDLLQELAEIIAQKLVDEKLEAHRAMAMAAQAVDEVQKRWKGMDIYIPHPNRQYQAEFRDAEILDSYDGTNASELCRKHGISHRRLRQIVTAGCRGSRGEKS